MRERYVYAALAAVALLSLVGMIVVSASGHDASSLYTICLFSLGMTAGRFASNHL